MRAGDETSASLTVLYDEGCGVCRRARDWLLTQPVLVPMKLLPAGAPAVRDRLGAHVPTLGEELVVIDDRGRVWSGPDAFLTCIWATARYRHWSYRLSSRALGPLAMRFFRLVSRRRHSWSRWLRRREDPDCSWCEDAEEWF